MYVAAYLHVMLSTKAICERCGCEIQQWAEHGHESTRILIETYTQKLLASASKLEPYLRGLVHKSCADVASGAIHACTPCTSALCGIVITVVVKHLAPMQALGRRSICGRCIDHLCERADEQVGESDGERSFDFPECAVPVRLVDAEHMCCALLSQ